MGGGDDRLGLALAQPTRRVLVITGDGEQLMGIGALATIAAKRLDNLSVVVLDNGQFGETGHQSSHTSLGADLAAAAAGCGWKATTTVTDMADIPALRDRLALGGAVRRRPHLRRRGARASCRSATGPPRPIGFRDALGIPPGERGPRRLKNRKFTLA
jgi:hypothetical protein